MDIFGVLDKGSYIDIYCNKGDENINSGEYFWIGCHLFKAIKTEYKKDVDLLIITIENTSPWLINNIIKRGEKIIKKKTESFNSEDDCNYWQRLATLRLIIDEYKQMIRLNCF